MAGDRPSRRREEEFGCDRHSNAAGAVGQAANVRAMTTVAHMPEDAAQNVHGEPLERSAHLRSRHSPASCNGALGARFSQQEASSSAARKKNRPNSWWAAQRVQWYGGRRVG